MAKNHDVYMPLIIGDWLKGTRGMKAEVKGVYLELLLYQWDNGFIPSEMDEIKLIVPEVEKVWDKLKDKFEKIAPGKLQNKKNEEVREFFSKQKTNGKKGGRPKNPNNNPKPNPNDNLHNGIGIEYGIGSENESKGGAGENLKPMPPSLAMIEDAFTENGLTPEQAKEFFTEVEGRQGWTNIHNWKIYTQHAIVKRINQKQNGTVTGKSNNRYSEQKQSVRDVKNLAIEVLRQSGGGDL